MHFLSERFLGSLLLSGLFVYSLSSGCQPASASELLGTSGTNKAANSAANSQKKVDRASEDFAATDARAGAGNTAQLDQDRAEAMRRANVRRLFSKYERLGITALKKDDYGTAIEMLGQAAQEAEVLKMSNADYAGCLQLLAVAYEKYGKSADSIKCQEKALEILNKSEAVDEKSKLDAVIRMASIYAETGDEKAATEKLQKALSEAETRGMDERTKCGIIEKLQSIAMDRGDFAAAHGFLEKLMQYDQKRPADLSSARHLEQMARLSWKDGNFEEARNLLAQSLQIRKSLSDPLAPSQMGTAAAASASTSASVSIAGTEPDSLGGTDKESEMNALLRNLISANLLLGVYDEPEQDIKTVLSYDRMHLAPDSPDYLFDLLSLAQIKLHGRETSAAKFLCQEVLNSQKDSHQENNTDTAQAYSLLARSAEAQKQWKEASSFAQQAINIRQKCSAPELLSKNDRELLARAELALQALAKTAEGLVGSTAQASKTISR
jgi:hypothetical protein